MPACRPDEADLLFPARRRRHDRDVLRPRRSADGGRRRRADWPETAAAGAGARGDRAAAGAEPAAQGGHPPRAGGAGAAAQRQGRRRRHRAHRRCHLARRRRPVGRFQLGTPSGRILAAIYSATLLYWLRDTSEDDAATLDFLDRRLAGLGRVRRVRGADRRDARPVAAAGSKLRMGDTG